MKAFDCAYPNLKNMLLRTGTTCADLAVRLGISTIEMYKRLYGKKRFSSWEQRALCRIFDAVPSWLFFEGDFSHKHDGLDTDIWEENNCEQKQIDLDSLVVQTAPKGKTYTFYLDEEVVLALGHLADRQNSNKSKVLNALLNKVLL